MNFIKSANFLQVGKFRLAVVIFIASPGTNMISLVHYSDVMVGATASQITNLLFSLNRLFRRR